MGTTKLKPRSTVLDENDNLVRLRPNGRAAGYNGASRFYSFNIAPNSTTEEAAGVTRHRRYGKIRWAIDNVEFVAIGDKSYQVQPFDGILNVASPLAVVLEDDDASIVEHRITINGKDGGGSPISDIFLYSVAGGTTVFTTNAYKEITSIIGDLTAGAPDAQDRILIGAAIPDTLHDLMGGNGYFLTTTVHDPHGVPGGSDWDGYYVEGTNIADKRVFVGFPNPRDVIPGYTTSVAAVTVRWWTKNIGATSNGIECIIRVNGVDYIQGTNTTTSVDEGTGIQTLVTLTVNPGTGNPWTLADLNGLEVGVIFKGDNPTIEKRWNRIRVDFNMNPGFVHNSIDGSLTVNEAEAWKAVNKDPFGVGPDDEYIMAPKNDGRRAWVYEDLPATATTVDWVDFYLRWAQINHGAVNGTSENTRPCALGGPLGLDPISIASRQGDGFNQDDGPLEQSNAGGNQIRTLVGSSGDSDRFLYGAGNTATVPCGGFPSGDIEGLDIGFGIFATQVFRRDNVFGNPITPANVNTAEGGWDTWDQNADSEWRFSQAFIECQFQRNPVGGVFAHLVIDDDPDGTPAVIDADYIPSQHSANKKFVFDFSGIPETSEITSVKIRVRARTTLGASRGWRAFWRVDGNDTFQTEETNTSFELKEYTRTTNPETGEKWTREEVNALQIGWESQGENDYWEKQFSVLELEVDFVEIPEKIDAARDIGSRRLRLYRKPVPLLTASLPLQFLDPGLMGKVAVTHRAIPTSDGVPGQERWERRLMRVLKEEVDLNNLRVKLTLLDLRDFLLTFWMTMKSRSKGLNFDGMAIMSAGTSVRFARKTNAWHPDPNDGLVNELSADEPKVNGDGILVEDGILNYLINSAFTEGATDIFTEWAKVGDGLAGASIVESTLAGFFKSSVAPRHVLITGATTPGDVYIMNQTPDVPTGAGISPTGSRYVVSVVHKDDDGYPLSYKLKRDSSFTSDQFLRVPNQAWSTVDYGWFTFPVRSVITRDFFPINTLAVGVGSETEEYLQVFLGAVTAANQKNRVYHVQVEGGTLLSGNYRTYPSSPIITKTGPVIRDADELFADNSVGRLTWPKFRGTFFGIFRPIWDSAYLEQGQSRRLYIVGNVYNSDNWDLVYYEIDDEELVFERKLAGITVKATKFVPAFTIGDEAKIAARWTSAEEELGLPAFTISIFHAGEKGTDATATGHLEPPSENEMYMGSRDGTELSMGDGTFSEFYITQQVLRDSEIRRLP